jgi:glycosyltransferase involved in cell wall biosynthesis
MRILILSSKGPGTGCILRARGIAGALRALGHRVTLVPAFPTMPLWLDMALDAPWYLLAGLFAKADLVLGVKPYPTLVPALAWQRWVHRARIVLDVDDLDYAYSGGAFGRIHQAVQTPWPRRADLVTYHNPSLRAPLAQVFRVDPSRMVQLPQGVDTVLFRKFEPRAEDLPRAARRFLPERPSPLPDRLPASDRKAKTVRTGPQRGPLLTYTAHLNGACGLKEVLESFALVRKGRPGAHLLVAGGGPHEYLFREQAGRLGVADAVTFTGMIAPREVAACLNLADLALVYYGPGPASDHRSSMKLREALACRARVAATDVGETRLFARHVHLARPDPASFAKAVLDALKGRPKPALPPGALAALNWSSCIQPLLKRTGRP